MYLTDENYVLDLTGSTVTPMSARMLLRDLDRLGVRPDECHASRAQQIEIQELGIDITVEIVDPTTIDIKQMPRHPMTFAGIKFYSDDTVPEDEIHFFHWNRRIAKMIHVGRTTAPTQEKPHEDNATSNPGRS